MSLARAQVAVFLDHDLRAGLQRFGVLVVWECGVLRTNFGGEVLWEKTFPCFSGMYAIGEGVARFMDMDDEKRWGYRHIDGSEVA